MHNDSPGERVFASFGSYPWGLSGGMVLDETDSYIMAAHVSNGYVGQRAI